ncbi:hypothetical protein JYG30_01460 [Fibrella sp. USSR17]
MVDVVDVVSKRNGARFQLRKLMNETPFAEAEAGRGSASVLSAMPTE